MSKSVKQTEIWAKFNSMPLKVFLKSSHVMFAHIKEPKGVMTRVRFDKKTETVVWEYLM